MTAAARRHEDNHPTACRTGSPDPRSVDVDGAGRYLSSYCPVHGISPCPAADIIRHHVTDMWTDGVPLACGRYRVTFISEMGVRAIEFTPNRSLTATQANPATVGAEYNRLLAAVMKVADVTEFRAAHIVKGLALEGFIWEETT